ncbi:acetyl-CoA carboxylase family protein [Thalassovita sp.]|uniref:acetyl-CoA carboxylase family protein n=1 Tax=Thalassovita sp. TaxID=1979401 RepID=UPI0029DE5232|nr:carboxyl transferase domain-containing protein [Thalassovita sp.]
MFRKLLVANRGEIALRISRAANELGIGVVAIYSTDDADCLHAIRAEQAVALPGNGAAAYLDQQAVINAALSSGCDAIHPGYGFLSENAEFADACAAAGLVFVGPAPDTLRLFGNKGAARALAHNVGLPLAKGTQAATTLAEAQAFLQVRSGQPIMLKALAGGGGRGMRRVDSADTLPSVFRHAASEAQAAFGSADLYVEEVITGARHIEVQVLGDAGGNITHLWERDCTLQRRHQKLVEIAPAPDLPPATRQAILQSALSLACAAKVQSLCTMEFLVRSDDNSFVFIEANPRLQVEHPVTEEITGIDLVQTQIRLAAGQTLAEIGIPLDPPAPRGTAIELRVTLESTNPDGGTSPSQGRLRAFDQPGGNGIRVETFGYAGYETSLAFDPLLAKVIAHTPSGGLGDALNRAARALAEFRIEGVDTNLPFLRALLSLPEIRENRIDTDTVNRLASHAVDAMNALPNRHPNPSNATNRTDEWPSAPDGHLAVLAPLGGTLATLSVTDGQAVTKGTEIAVISAMKMEHQVLAPASGTVRLAAGVPGQTVTTHQPLAFFEPGDAGTGDTFAADTSTEPRADLEEVRHRQHLLTDDARPDAVARRRKTGQRTARENIADLSDPGSFTEYGGLALAAQHGRHGTEKLTRISPADGLVAGLCSVNAPDFGDQAARCMAMSYDYTVFAGTQGFMNHKKMDRMLKLASEWSLPIVIFAEGGGGRPGDSDFVGVAGLDLPTFGLMARHSGKAPMVAIVSGRCFAGNAAVAGVCDVIIATEGANLGMGGPAMIEGGGLGVFAPEDVGPMPVQTRNGVVDILVKDEAEATRTARKYLSYFQGALTEWNCADQTRLRDVVPPNRLRVYDIRQAIDLLADTDSVLELRPDHGPGILTALIRIEGRPMGLIANNSGHLSGAIDAEAAEKAARFLDICETFGLPVLSLCDTPGFIVGPSQEETALVRRVSRMFLSGANLSVPFVTVVLRKGYGLGAMAMAAGSFHRSMMTIAWPSGEFGGMGLEGAVRLGYRKELAAAGDPAQQQALFEELTAALYEKGKALSMASFLEIDNVIDPAETRSWILRALNAAGHAESGPGKRRPFVPSR